jgi:hypothetical protein
MQWLEMHEGGKQTDRIIAADERTANAMEDTVKQSQVALDKTVREMEKQLVLVQRPWLGGEGFVSYSSKVDSNVADFSVTVKNFGTAPALNVGLSMDRFVLDGFEKKIAFICSEAKEKSKNGRYIFPGSTYNYPLTRQFVSVNIGAPPDAKLLLAGCIAYFGQFKDFHHTEFCFTSALTASKNTDQPLVPCAVKQGAD